MNRYVDIATSLYDDPQLAWQWALKQRERDNSQALANAEHYLWNRYYAGQGPLEAAGAFVTPFGYYAAKKAGLLGARSDATLGQLGAGLLGAIEGVK